MSRGDCFRTLGIAPESSWETVRQAYKDLVRVWHPDRFQSDPELQLKADQQLQKINEAYFTLKTTRASAESRPQPPPPPKPAEPPPVVNDPPPPRPASNRFALHRLFRGPLKLASWGLICLAPLVVGGFLMNMLRIPALDSVLAQGGEPRAGMLTPSGGGPSTADGLSSLAHKATGLWNSIPEIGHSPAPSIVPPAAAVPRKADIPPREQPHRPEAVRGAPGAPANGTELLRPRLTGGSQMWVSNAAGQDVVASLVDAGTASPVRVIYIRAKNQVCIRDIAPGTYNLLAEMGDHWDPKQVRFQSGRETLERKGPFQCIDLSSTRDISGQCMDVSSGRSASKPKNDIVLTAR